MKKFVIMTLVLCLASYASAGLSWTVAGSTSGDADPLKVSAGDTLTLTLSESVDDVIAVVIDQVTDSSTEGLFTGSSVSPNFTTITKAGMSVPAFDSFLTGYAYPASGMPLDDWCWFDANWTAGTMVTGAFLTLNYTAPTTLGAYTIAGGTYGPPLQGKNAVTTNDGVNPNVTVTMPTLGITVIPEPMTMVLLGLGGLFLRRRK